jgi:hypothetical protein
MAGVSLSTVQGVLSMATVILKKAYKNARGEYKAGERISVPFGEGRMITADGTAEYPKENQSAAVVPIVAQKTPAERYEADIARIRAEHSTAMKAVREECDGSIDKIKKEHLAEVAKLKADLDAAEKLATEPIKKK